MPDKYTKNCYIFHVNLLKKVKFLDTTKRNSDTKIAGFGFDSRANRLKILCFTWF
jgi:hypothetical protein